MNNEFSLPPLQKAYTEIYGSESEEFGASKDPQQRRVKGTGKMAVGKEADAKRDKQSGTDADTEKSNAEDASVLEKRRRKVLRKRKTPQKRTISSTRDNTTGESDERKDKKTKTKDSSVKATDDSSAEAPKKVGFLFTVNSHNSKIVNKLLPGGRHAGSSQAAGGNGAAEAQRPASADDGHVDATWTEDYG